MGIEELRIIAEIMGGLESTGITGFLAFLGVQILEVLLWAGIILVVIWCGYKLVNRALDSTRDSERCRQLARILGNEYYGNPSGAEWQRVVDTMTELYEIKGKLSEQRHSLKDYMGRLGSLSKDYETLWDEHEKTKEKLEIAQKHCITLEQEITAIRRANDPSINSDFDRPQEEPNERREEQQDTGVHAEREPNDT